MKFAHPWWLAGTTLSLVLAALLVISAFLLLRAGRRFGDDDRIAALVTDRPAGRRALKGVLLVVAIAAGFVALAQPQYGRGTRLIPATNLDVVVVLDYSKSMYARDVTPSRIERAKTEVSTLIAELPGARFGAVAFAGEPVSFPLTSDGSSIAQFFRQLSPSDMPVGGTAIARALEAARQLLARDPLANRHKKVILLVTDGEDLEGDPVTVAKGAANDGVTINVVQIGGRTPEPVPEVNEAGEVVGLRSDSEGKPLTTSLSADGEKQLTEIGHAASGTIVRSDHGETGIREVARSMRKMMTEELSERVETIYADVFMYPAGLAVFLLAMETFIGEARRQKKRTLAKARWGALGTVAVLSMPVLGACDRGLSSLFMRYSPDVDRAVSALDAGAPDRAADLLETYLSTGACKSGEIGTPDKVRALPNASFDLGLALFQLGERFGARFGEESTGQANPEQSEKRSAEVDCALHIVQLAATDPTTPVPLRARAHYLAGNLEFLRGDYRAAVAAYDSALKLIPGRKDGDLVGRNAAHNRAVALRRIEDEKKPDAGRPDGGNEPDGGARNDGGKTENNEGDGGAPKPDGGSEQNEQGKDSGAPKDSKQEEKDKQDQKKQQEQQQQQQQQQQEQQAKESQNPSLTQDDRMLDVLEQAPTVQQQTARQRSTRRRFVGMEDK